MSITAHTPLIHSLNDDLLWHIFNINANMFIDEDALTTTRFTSQVCRAWQYNMLSTGTLWGRLIDLDSLHGLKSSEWGEELVRRSGTSLLWIKGDRDRHYYHSPQWITPIPPTLKQQAFFLSVITEHWPRIQRLVLTAPVMFDITTWEDLSVLRRPAPNLEQFHVESLISHGSTSGLEVSIFEDLFSGQAPALRQFCAKTIKIDIQTPWFHNLHSIQLGCVFDVYECLTILSATPNLQHLMIENSKGPMSYSPHTIVTLPKLERLKFVLDFWEISFMLDHLRVRHGCSLDLFTGPGMTARHRPESISSTYTRVTSSFYQASRHYFQSHPPRALDVKYSENMGMLRDDTYHDSSTFQLGCNSWCDSSVVLANIFAALAFPEFAGVTELQLRYDEFLPITDFPIFLQCLSSVEILQTDEQSLAHLIDAQKLLQSAEGRPVIIFPQLRLIKICALRNTIPPPAVGARTVSFIMSRIIDQHPITVLDLTACSDPVKPSRVIPNLQDIRSLKVILKINTTSDV